MSIQYKEEDEKNNSKQKSNSSNNSQKNYDRIDTEQILNNELLLFGTSSDSSCNINIVSNMRKYLNSSSNSSNSYN